MFDCADPTIAAIYAYRWKLYKAHLRDLGPKWLARYGVPRRCGVANVSRPRCSTTPRRSTSSKAAWLRDRRPLDAFVGYLWNEGGNDRHFSEGNRRRDLRLRRPREGRPRLRRALLAGDAPTSTASGTDHFDFAKGLYWIEPSARRHRVHDLLHRRERRALTASGAATPSGPRSNSATSTATPSRSRASPPSRAIPRPQKTTPRRAAILKTNGPARPLERRAGPFHGSVPGQTTRRRSTIGTSCVVESLEGYVPWAYGLPDDTPKYAAAWRHLLDAQGVGRSRSGCAPSNRAYEYYMHVRYRYQGDRPECQWNGPAWPFQEDAGPDRHGEPIGRRAPGRRAAHGLRAPAPTVRAAAPPRRQAEPPGGLQSRHPGGPSWVSTEARTTTIRALPTS